MKKTSFDKNIQEQLKNRTFQPSKSSWERLAVQLDSDKKKQQKKMFLSLGYAASFLVIISVGFLFNINKNRTIKQQISLQEKGIKSVKGELQITFSLIENTVIGIENIEKNAFSEIVKKATNLVEITNTKTEKVNLETSKKNKTQEVKKVLLKKNNFSIKVNSDALLYAATHSENEIKKYYSKYQIDRKKVLKSIENELRISKIKMTPNLILTAVEKEIREEDFQNNFMKSIKKRVTNFAIAFASRNE